jgi:hypothetical protein
MNPFVTRARRLTWACSLLALASVAQAQQADRATPKPHYLKPMTTQNATLSAFFYQQPVLLDREQHKALRLQPGDARFAASNQSVPLVAAEFPQACLEYPIVFSKGQGDRWLALALTGLTLGSNAFVNAQGQWNARYVPASVRRYPFILAEGDKQQLSLAADLAAPHLGAQGEPLFDDKGEPTELARNVMSALADFQQQAANTHELLQQLDEAQVLSQQNLQVRLGDGQQAVVEGVWIVDEAKLRTLPADKVLAWFKTGQLAAIHAQMLSLRNLLPLLERSLATNPGAAGQVGEAAPADQKTGQAVAPSASAS